MSSHIVLSSNCMSILELEVHHMLELQVPCDVTLVYLKTFIMFASLNCLVQFFLPTLIFSGSFIPAAKFPSYRHSGMKPILSRSVSLLPALFDCSAPQSEVRTLLLLSLSLSLSLPPVVGPSPLLQATASCDETSSQDINARYICLLPLLPLLPSVLL